MNFWHMQLFPGGSKNPEEETKQALEQGVIGLGCGCNYTKLSTSDRSTYDDFFRNPCGNIESFVDVIARNLGFCGCAGGKRLKRVLQDFCKIQEKDIVLIHCGQTPFALVRVISHVKTPSKTIAWFEPRKSLIRDIEILRKWYSNNQNPERWEEIRGAYIRATLGMVYENELKSKISQILEEIMLSNLTKILQNHKQIILYGPPGTGKTYRAKQITAKMLGLEPEAGVNEKHPEANDFQKARFGSTGSSKAKGKWALVQFHPSYNYEDFVRGIAVTTENGQVKYEVKDRIFVQMCKEASANKDKSYVLIIDEINRANLAAVLGELIYALEYRDEEVHLPYGDESLKVPSNLYIIGTMNTADRSIGHIDYAVRRRFAFVQELPKREVIEQHYKDENLRKVALDLFDAVEKLFGKDGCLSPDYHKEDVQPGHSYFLAEDIEELAFKFAYQVWPLLKEYCKDGVLLCESENCKIELNGQSFPLKDHVTPEKIFEAVRGLMSKFEEKSEENAKETNGSE